MKRTLVFLPLLLLLAAGCNRQDGGQCTSVRLSATEPATTMPTIRPGPGIPEPASGNPIPLSRQAIMDGQRIYNDFGCVGCHAGGGGGMGPPLIDAKWIYGSEPAQIYSSIIEGRPQGMPAFRGRIAPNDIWKLTMYVRALSGLEGEVPKGANSSPLQDMSGENLQSAPQDLQDYYREALRGQGQ